MSDWVARICLHLRLSGEAGVLLLVDEADPRRLRELCLALLPDAPELEVYTEPADLLLAPVGAVSILIARAEHASWLQLHRPRFASQRRKVIVFSDAPTTRALSLSAPDFMDWMSLRVACPEGVAMFAVHAIRAAARARAPIGWDSAEDFVARCSRAFAVALPRSRLEWLESGRLDRLAAIRSMAGRWIGIFSPTRGGIPSALASLRRTHHQRRSITIAPRLEGMRVHDYLVDPGLARTRLREAGFRRPGLVLALLDLEQEAVDEALALAPRESKLLAELPCACDPGLLAADMAGAHVDENTLRSGGPRARLAAQRGARWGDGGAQRSLSALSPDAILAEAKHEDAERTIGTIDAQILYFDADPASYAPLLARLLARTGRALFAERLLLHALGAEASPAANDAPPLELPGLMTDFVLADFLLRPPPPLSSPLRAEAARALADLYLAQGRYAEAELRLREAVGCYAPDDPRSAAAVSELGWALALQDRLDEALEVAQRAVALEATAREPNAVGAAWARVTMGRVLARRNDPNGVAIAREALMTLTGLLGPDDLAVTGMRRELSSRSGDGG